MTVSATEDTITCPRLTGPVDAHGNQYAGPPCEGCDQCKNLSTLITYLQREFPYKPCVIEGHDHQMFACMPCRELNRHRERNVHLYCPERGNPHESETHSDHHSRERRYQKFGQKLTQG